MQRSSAFLHPISFSLDPADAYTNPSKPPEKDIELTRDISTVTQAHRNYVRQLRKQACIERIVVDDREEAEEELVVYWDEGYIGSFKDYWRKRSNDEDSEVED